MKKAVILLFLLSCFAATSQPLRKVRHVILIRNLNNARFLRIPENSFIYIETTSGKIILEKIRMIKEDTLFFSDTLVRTQDIDRLQYPLSHIRPTQTYVDPSRPTYLKGSHWQIISPPDSVYRNYWGFTNYYRGLAGDVREKWLLKLDPLVYKNFLKWNLTKIVHLELGISYERVIAKNLSWENEVSGIVGIPSSYFSMINYPVFNYNGISITTYPKYYFIPRTYVSFVFMYRYLSVRGMKCNWPRDGTSVEFKDQYRNDYGISLRIGFMRRYGKIVIDYYVGGGIKYITTHDLVYGYYPEDSSHHYWIDIQGHSPKIYNKNLFGPVFNLGFKIGRAFGR